MSWARGRVDERMARLLAMGATQEAAAADSDVSTRTVRRRLEDPEFVARVAELREELLGEASGKAASLVVEALDAMRELLGSKSELVRLKAALAVVRTASDLVDRMELRAELDELRRRHRYGLDERSVGGFHYAS